MRQAFRALSLLLLFASPSAVAQLTGQKVRIFLCDTEAAALAFASALAAPRTTKEMASNVVNRSEKRDACNRYIGYVGKEVEVRKVVDGLVYKVTRYRLHFSDRRGVQEAYAAERLFDAGSHRGYIDL
jgi:hypothetical protein